MSLADDVVNAIDDGEEVEYLMRRFYPLIVESAFGDASLAGVPVAFDLENDEIQGVIDRMAITVRQIAQTTREQLRDLIRRQASEGLSTEKLARTIRDMSETVSQSRASTIARTETGIAYNTASVTAYRQGGVTHVDVLDGDDDDVCAAANGARWTLEEAEANPLGHPNCIRAFSPVVE